MSEDAWRAYASGVKALNQSCGSPGTSSAATSPSAADASSDATRLASSRPPATAAQHEWAHERASLLAQISALRLNLSTSAKSNQALQRELHEARLHNGSAAAASGGGATPLASPQDIEAAAPACVSPLRRLRPRKLSTA